MSVLGSAFNCAIDPEVDEKCGCSNPCPRKSALDMEVSGGQEAKLSSNSEDTTKEETEILQIISTTLLNKPKQLLASSYIPKDVVPETFDSDTNDLLEEESIERQANDIGLREEEIVERVDNNFFQSDSEPT